VKGALKMNMIESATIIRGKGQCEAYMNGVVMEEMRKQNDRHAFEKAVMKAQINRYQEDRIKYLNAAQRESWLHRIKEKIENAWCVFFAMLLELHLIEEVEDEL